MRKNRVIEQNRCYHLVSRREHRAFFLDDEEKVRAVALMRRVEAGVQADMSYYINRAVSISADPLSPLGNRIAKTSRTGGSPVQWRRTSTVSSFVFADSIVWLTQTNIVSCSDSAIAPLVTSSARQLTGLSAALPARSRTYDVRGNVTEKETLVDSSFVASRETLPYATNKPLSLSRCGVSLMGVSVSAVTNTVAYDALGRQIAHTDGRGNTRHVEYNAIGQRSTSIDALGNRTIYSYVQFGNLASVTDPLGNATVYEYDLRGYKTYEGGATYPVRYTYDIFGNKTSMTTYRDETSRTGGSPVQGDVTTWLYDIASGSMTNKVYADGKGPTYSYSPDGKLSRRTWARGIVTDYSYDNWGSITNTVYSDNTPTVSLAYDVLGRQIEAHDAAGVTTFLYDSFGTLTNETVIGVAGTNTIERFWDDYGRTAGYALNGIRQTTIGYGLGTARIETMQVHESTEPNLNSPTPTQNSNCFVWSYLPGSDLKSSLSYPNGLTAAWTYDANGQLLQVCNAFPTNVISQYDYTYDAAGRRVSCGKTGSAFAQDDTVAYAYNNRSELTNAVAAIDAECRYAYAFDDIGNRLTSSERGTNSVYAANQLNQYTEISDSALSASPRETFTPQFDDDGNQTRIKTATGIWQVQYNGENRPILWENVSTNSPTPNSSTPNSTTPPLISMSFDRMGRRVTKNAQRFVYDGYLQIANFEHQTSNIKLQTFIWDPTEPVATRPLAWLVLRSLGEGGYYTHDGNKNVSEVVAENGDVCAHYDYAPFGAVTSAVGDSAMANPWRFSSEYAENETETVYYNYRHYNPTEGRWAYRDLFENLVLAARLHPWRSSQENLYSAVNNRTSFAVDALGLTDVVSNQEFPGAHQVGNKWWLYVDDGQNGKVELIRCTRDDLRDQMRSAAIQLCIYQRDDWIPTRAYETGFDTRFFVGENKQHSYYYIEGESQIWADNEVNYIGIGMYEAWLGSPKWLGSATIVSWKVLRWGTLPTDGTFYWYNYGYDNFDSYYSQLDKCTCKPKDGSSWYYDGSTYSAKRPGGHRNSRYGR